MLVCGLGFENGLTVGFFGQGIVCYAGYGLGWTVFGVYWFSFRPLHVLWFLGNMVTGFGLDTVGFKVLQVWEWKQVCNRFVV